VLLVVPTIFTDSKQRVTVKSVKALLRTITPLGSTKDQVIAALSNRQIEHSEYLETVETKFVEVDEAVEQVSQDSRIIHAAIRNVDRIGSIEYGIFIKFYFERMAN
jgi:hypothetical protein